VIWHMPRRYGILEDFRSLKLVGFCPTSQGGALPGLGPGADGGSITLQAGYFVHDMNSATTLW